MTTMAPVAMTLTDFLVWEEQRDARWEFDGKRPVLMDDVTIAHDALTFNLRDALASRLVGRGCRPHGPNVKVKTDTSVRYPDVVVNCVRQSPTATILADPLIIFEVASKTTRGRDVVEKNREYQSLPSLQRHVVVEQSQRLLIVFARAGDAWTCAFISGEGADLPLPELGIAIPLDEIYAGVELIPEPDPEEA